MNSPQELSFLVDVEDAGARLDVVVSRLTGESRSRISGLIRDGDVRINDVVPAKTGVPLRLGDGVWVRIPAPPSTVALPEALPVSVVYEDEHLIVINKAADMVVHPSVGHESGTLVNALVHRFGALAPDLGTEDGRPRPGIVHRLDLGTSGLLVVARDTATRDALSLAISERRVERRYIAIVHGTRLAETGTWSTLHDRHQKDRRRFTSKTETGRTAVTHWTVLRRGRAVSLIECKLETGRTHQIRVHCCDHLSPIVGDTLYGGDRPIPGPESPLLRPLSRQALHALTLAFVHPATGQMMRFHGQPPPDLAVPLQRVFGIADAVSDLAGS